MKSTIGNSLLPVVPTITNLEYLINFLKDHLAPDRAVFLPPILNTANTGWLDAVRVFVQKIFQSVDETAPFTGFLQKISHTAQDGIKRGIIHINILPLIKERFFYEGLVV